MEGKVIEEKYLIKKLREGDIDAFNRLFELYSSKLYHFSCNYFKTKEDSEELVQETFCKLWDKRKNIKEDQDFRSYLFTIAFNHIKKHFRSKAVINKYIEYSSVIDQSNNYIEEDINYSSLKSLVDKLVEKLPDKRKAVFIKSRIEGKSNADISEELKISKSTVENHLNLALKYLKKHLNNEHLAAILFWCLFIN